MVETMDQQQDEKIDWYKLENREKSLERLLMIKEKYVNKEDVAIAGFYFCVVLRTIKCYSCNVEVAKWYPEDNPFVKHWIINPSCKHLNENSTCKLRGPKIKEYVDIRHRKMSFQNWPNSLPINSTDMADAGFYYTGKEDAIKCYYCGIELGNWEESDNPWIEHCRHRPKCEFLLSEKGFYEIQVIADMKKKNSDPRRQQPSRRKTQTDEHSPRKTEKYPCEKCNKEYKVECFVPCGHVVYCSNCVDYSIESCPKCGTKITKTVRLFI